MSEITPIVKGVFLAIAKTKQKTWKAMKSAFGTVIGAAGAFGTIASTLRLLSPIILIFNKLLKIIGVSILKSLMPVLIPFLKMLTSPTMLAIMEDIGELIGSLLVPALVIFSFVLELLAPIIAAVTGFLVQNKWILGLLMLSLNSVIGIIGFLIWNWELVVSVLRVVGNAFIWFINKVISGINTLMKVLTFGFAKSIPNIPYLHTGGVVPRTGIYMLQKKEEVIPARNAGRSNGEIHIHLDLRNAVVDNVDRLIQTVTEQVLIQIG